MVKRIMIVLCVFVPVLKVIAQEITNDTINDSDKIHRFVDKKAKPNEEMINFLQAFTKEFNSIVIPPKFDEISFKLKFVVEKDGSFSNIEIKENEHAYAYIEEVVRVLNKLPAWNPAEIKGKKVRSFHILPIKLRFPMRNVDKVLLDKAILERTITNDFFEFECNCKLINNNTNNYNKVNEFAYSTTDNKVFYSITLKEILVNNATNHFDLIKANSEKQNAIINEIDYKNYKAIESNYIIFGKGNTYYNNTLYFVADNYLVTLNVISTNEQISKFNFQDLKQTFKLKI